ncbi:unnamed protein product, partial [Meganyctiphanes norvegica]
MNYNNVASRRIPRITAHLPNQARRPTPDGSLIGGNHPKSEGKPRQIENEPIENGMLLSYQFKGDENVEEELVIPMIELDRSAIFKKLAEKAQKRKFLEEIEGDKDDTEITEDADTSDDKESVLNKRPLTLEEQAEAAIIEESKQGVENWKNRAQNDNLTIPVGTPIEEDSLTTIGKESNLDEYDEIGVDNFGSALLRGMGWKKKEGIGGKTGKRVVEIVEPTARQFGQIAPQGKGTSDSSKEEEMELKNGSYIFIHSGRSRGSYGTVESVDEDHILVRRAMTNDVVREVEANVRVVTQKEFKDSSRVINKEMYDEYKAKQGSKGKEEKENTEEKAVKNKYKDEDRHENDAQVNSDDEQDIKKEECITGKTNKSFNKDKFNDQTEKNYDIKEEKHEKYDKNTIKNSKDSKYGNKYDRISHDENDRSNKEDREERKDKLRETLNRDEYAAIDDYNHSKEDYKDYDRKYKDNRDKSDYYQNKDKDYSKDSYDKKYNYDRINKKDKYSKERVKDKNETYKYNKYENDRHEEKDKYEGKRSRYDDNYKEVKKPKVEKLPAMPWIRENLRVRLINKNFKGGKYHKEKMVNCVRSEVSGYTCIFCERKSMKTKKKMWLETFSADQPQQLIPSTYEKWGFQRDCVGNLKKMQNLYKSRECLSMSYKDSGKLLKICAYN